MNKKIFEILGIIAVFPFGFWAVSEIALLPALYQIYAAAVGLAMLAMLLFGRGLPFDLKFVIALCFGYALAGRGFAYISIKEPLYIGELAFIVGCLGFVVRLLSGAPVAWKSPQFAVAAWILLIACYIPGNYTVFGMLTLRDSSMGYYSFFAIMMLYALQEVKAREAIEKSFVWMILFGMISALTLYIPPILDAVMRIPVFARLFYPHPDSFVPWLVAGSSYGIFIGIQKKSLSLIFLGAIGMFLLLTTKTAGIFSLALTWLALLLFAQRREVLVLGIITGTFVAILSAAISLGNIKTLNDYAKHSDHVATFTDINTRDGSGSVSTTDWRIVWWTIVFQDTMKHSPVFGAGLGGDITSHFIRATYKRPITSADARYPHNFVFTVLGRLGLVGVAVAGIIWTVIVGFLYCFARDHLRKDVVHPPALIAFTYVVGGMANSLVQTTYEAPYAAIPHWALLGYLMAYYQAMGRKAKTSEVEVGEVPFAKHA